MAPFTAWLPVKSERISDLVLKVVGAGTAGLVNGAAALEAALTDQGLQVMAQTSKLGGKMPGSAVRLRVSAELITSMGNGCDVIACTDRLGLQEKWFGLQPGSVFVHEAVDPEVRAAAVAEGVITYPVPFADLHRRCGSRFAGKGLIAAGVLTHLLEIPEDLVRCRVRPLIGLRYFDAGVRFASTHLEKRDIYALPLRSVACRQIILDVRQALLLGLTIGHCDCRSVCTSLLDGSPTEWLAEHIRAARSLVSCLTSRQLPGVTVYRGPDGYVMGLLGTADPTAVKGDGTHGQPIVLVPSDMLDALRLVGAARQMAHQGTKPVWVVADEILTNRQQSVSLETLLDVVWEIERGANVAHSPILHSTDLLTRSDREGEGGADVGFIAWGTAQGVVREAVAICRGFGLKVAALYPKVLRPVPTQDVEAFAETVGSLVIVEPGRAGRYTKLMRAATSVRCTTLVPESRRGLTPMDIFLREGLGT